MFMQSSYFTILSSLSKLTISFDFSNASQEIVKLVVQQNNVIADI